MRSAAPRPRLLLLLCSALAGIGGGTARGQDPDPQERAAVLRAMVILKIAPYLAPEPKPAPRAPAPTPPKAGEQAPGPTYRIGLCGHDDVSAAAAKHLPQKRVGDAAVATVAVPAASAAAPRGDEPRPYDLLYIAADTPHDVVARIVAAHANEPVPLVCEQRGFAARGGGVQLFVQDNTLRFEVNVDALKQQGVRASPQLLKLSKEAPK